MSAYNYNSLKAHLFLIVICNWGRSTLFKIPDKWTASCFLLYWSVIRMVGLVHRTKQINRPFEYCTIWKPDFKCFRLYLYLSKYAISLTKYGIQMVGIQIPNVFGSSLSPDILVVGQVILHQCDLINNEASGLFVNNSKAITAYVEDRANGFLLALLKW